MAQDHVFSGFWNSINHDRKYDADDANRILDGLISDGVLKGFLDSLKVQNNVGMNVIVNKGRAIFNNIWTYVNAIINLTIESSDPTLARKDAVVLEINTNYLVRNNSIKIIKGTPTEVTSYDSLPLPEMKNEEELHQYPLAYILVKPNVTEITTEDVIDNRGKASCPYAAPLATSNGIDSTYGIINKFEFVDEEPKEEEMELNKLYFTKENS